MDMRAYRRDLIRMHPTFCCPISGEILDVDESHVIRYMHPITHEWTIDVVSFKGLEILKSKRPEFKTTIIERIEDL